MQTFWRQKNAFALVTLLLAGCGVSQTPIQTLDQQGGASNTQTTRLGQIENPKPYSGHILCVSGQTDNIIRLMRPEMQADAFPASYYMEDTESKFPITEIADLSPLRADKNELLAVLSGNGGLANTLNLRFLYLVRINFDQRSYTLKRLADLPSAKELSSYRRALKQVGVTAPIAQMLTADTYLAPEKMKDGTYWTIRSLSNDTSVETSAWKYPEYFHPQIQSEGSVVSFQTIRNGKLRKVFFQKNSSTGWDEITPTDTVDPEADALGGDAIAKDAAYWWIEKTAHNASLVYFSLATGNLIKTAIPLTNEETVAAKHLQIVRESRGTYKVGIVISRGDINEIRKMRWSPESGSLQIEQTITLQGGPAGLPSSLISDGEYIFTRQQNNAGEESFLRYSDRQKSWDRFAKTSCSGNSDLSFLKELRGDNEN